MIRPVFAVVAMLALIACGGSKPAGSTTAAKDSGGGGADSPAGPPAKAGKAPLGGKEFQLEKSDASKRSRGVNPSKIKATASEAAIRFVVVDKDKGPIPGIVVSLTAPDGDKYYTEETDAKGYAEVLVPIGKKYDLVYLSLGRRNVSAKVTVNDEPNQNLNLTLRYKRYRPPVAPASKPGSPEGKPGAPAAPRFVLKGVTFDTGKATIRKESFARLDSVVEYMTHKKSARIEVSGHTDNVGKPKRNKALSKKRAQACRDYLISKGIDGSRIEAVGYGDAMPIASNDTEEGRQKNRRIEATEL